MNIRSINVCNHMRPMVSVCYARGVDCRAVRKCDLTRYFRKNDRVGCVVRIFMFPLISIDMFRTMQDRQSAYPHVTIQFAQHMTPLNKCTTVGVLVHQFWMCLGKAVKNRCSYWFHIVICYMFP